MKDVAYVRVSATLKYHFLRNHTSNSTTFYGHHTSAFRYGNHVDWELGWGGTSVKGPERDKLTLFESSARLTTVNAGWTYRSLSDHVVLPRGVKKVTTGITCLGLWNEMLLVIRKDARNGLRRQGC